MAAIPIVHVLSIVDGVSEEAVEIKIFQSFIAKDFHVQFDVDLKKDPDMLDRYSVGPDDVPFLEKRLEDTVNFDFRRFAYFIEAVQNQ